MPNNLHTILAAKRLLNEPITGVLSTNEEQLLESAKKIPGLSRLLVVEKESEERFLPENLIPDLVAIQREHKFTHWLVSHSTLGKNVFARFGACLPDKFGSIPDVIEILGENKFKRPIYAGDDILSG